jgi:hypothetical protein
MYWLADKAFTVSAGLSLLGMIYGLYLRSVLFFVICLGHMICSLVIWMEFRNCE